MIFLRLFSRRWLVATFLVLVGTAVLARLGIWQLDRLAARRQFNARVQSQIERPVLDFNLALSSGEVSSGELVDMEYRQVSVVGRYDFTQEVALRNQARGTQWGVDLLTPLKIQGSEQYVMVDRGWIPAEDFESGSWDKYAEPGEVTVRGVIRRSQAQPDFGSRSDPTLVPGETRLAAWNFANLPRIAEQTPYRLLPVYIQQAPESGQNELPSRSQPKLELSEGPHMGYALQWFSFSVLLLVGYPFFVRRQEQRSK